MPASRVGVEELVERSWRAGSEADLTGIRRLPTLASPPSYYRFLNGLCRVVKARRILEIGTDHGGSILAMRRAVEGAVFSLVTVDTTNASDEQLGLHPEIVKIQGDSRSEDVIARVLDCLSPAIDLLYVDAAHDFECTMASYAIYASLLEPRYLVFDDVSLNEQMRAFWSIIRRRYGANAVDAARLIPAIRPQTSDPGFGVVIASPAAG